MTTSAQATGALRPRPATTSDTAFFWEAARRHVLLVQRCEQCGALRHPPTAACARCGSLASTPVECTGRGHLFSYTVLHAPLAPAFTSPHIGALVALDEGVRLVSELVGVTPENVEIGMALQCEWLDCDPGLTVPRFRPA